LPPKLDRISFLLPILSTSQTPTNVNIKLTKAVTAANQIAVDWSLDLCNLFDVNFMPQYAKDGVKHIIIILNA
jgi:hypothetical protein